MLDRNSALRGMRVPGRFGGNAEEPGVTIEEIKEFSLLEIALWDGESASLRSRLSELLNLQALPETGRAMSIGDGRLIRLAAGPLLYVGAAGPADILAAAVTPEEGSVVSLSHGRCCLRLGGPMAADLLKRGIRTDLREAAFPAGSAMASDIGGLGILLIRNDAASFDLLLPRSRATVFWRWLTRRASAFGYDVL